MANQPWFKFYAADYLLDADVDNMPPEAEGLLVRMWTVCHLEGSCPDNPEELARKIRRPLQYVVQCKPHCQPFFELQDSRLYSRRMQEEKLRSERASKNASQRYNQKTCANGSVNGNANGSANCPTQSQSQSQSQIENKYSCSESSSEQAVPAEELAGKFPLNDGTKFPITIADLKVWQEAYPAVDVRQELKKLKAWFISNRNRRKTRSGIKRFVNSWLSREQDKFHRGDRPNGKGERPKESVMDRINRAIDGDRKRVGADDGGEGKGDLDEVLH